MPKNGWKIRKCLRCEREFRSFGNRRCKDCHEQTQGIEDRGGLHYPYDLDGNRRVGVGQGH